MSATSTRVDWEHAAPDQAPPLEEGNRVLESIGRKESLRALLAFSDLHEQIRNRRSGEGTSSDCDLFQTERFVLDEVLQLICDRIQTIIKADGVIVALADKGELTCRATSGTLSISQGAQLSSESDLLRTCFQNGRILRCDDVETDRRAHSDCAQKLGARSTVLIPLRGKSQRLGVLQAFSNAPWAFADHDVRCLDLFAELVLAALRPDDQDRRLNWLSDVASEVLHVQAVASAQIVDKTSEAPVETVLPSSAENISAIQSVVPDVVLPEFTPSTVLVEPAVSARNLTEVEPSGLPIEIPEEIVPFQQEEKLPVLVVATPFWRKISLPGGSRPGLSVVMGLVAVAALFSIGVWWRIELQYKTLGGQTIAARTAPTNLQTAGLAATAATSASGNSASPASDNLMDAAPSSSGASLVPVPEAKLAALPKITDVRHWASSMGSTVVIDMEDQVPYEVHRLMSPERIYFDLHDTVLRSDLNGKTIDIGDVSLSKLRVAQPVPGVTRIVLDTKDGSNFSVSMESNPYRLVIELRDTLKPATRLATAAPAVTKPAANLTTAASNQPLPANTGKFRIVLDAGHGGWDLGTVGRQGLLEKDLVLDVTQRLGKLLRARLGSEVMFTRQGDEYLPLDQRADFANRAQADLFISVHANYSNAATARGVETYYTNSFSAPGSKEVEKHSDGSSVQPTPISLSVGDLHEKIAESRHLAASVQRSLYAALASKSPDIRDRGIKDASFVVLTGTRMPAILTEISFVSSPADEHNLQSEAYRQQIAEALYKGIARYEESAPRAKIAKLQSAAARQ
jgi:N-acetylmuramoyl-L-alanine amidase/putative methionine-R-sulfoxide reductase with GAF domain